MAPLVAQKERDHLADNLSLLLRHFDDFRQQRLGRVVCIHTPSAYWADDLLRSLKHRVLAQHVAFFEAECEGRSGTYGPLRQLLTQYYTHLQNLGVVDAELVSSFREIAPILGIGGSSISGALQGPASPLGFWEQLGTLLQKFTAKLPSVMVVRDIHLADSTTRAALSFLVENVALDPLDSFAPEDVVRDRFRGFLLLSTSEEREEIEAFLGRSPRIELMTLEGVDEAQVRRFLQEPAVVQRFLRSSGGDPENLQALVRQLPAQVDDLLERRLRSLAPESRQLMEILAVFGRPIQPDLLYKLCSQPAESFGEQIKGLRASHLLRQEITSGRFLLQIDSPSVTQYLYGSISKTGRRELHRRVGLMLEERAHLGEPRDVEELAHHFLNSDDVEKAISYASEAAEKLHMTFAYERAAEFLVAALPKVEERQQRRDLLTRLVEIYTSLNSYQRALYYCGYLKKETPQDERVSVYRKVSEILLRSGRYDRALASLERAERCNIEQGELEALKISAVRAEAHYGQGEWEQALEVCGSVERGQALEGGPQHIRQVFNLDNTLGKIHIARGRYDEALHCFESNITRSQRMSWPDERARALFNCGIIALLRNEYEYAERHFLEYLDFQPNTLNPTTRAICLLNLAVLYHQTQRWAKALEFYLHSLATFKNAGAVFQFVATSLNLGELYLSLGDFQRAQALADAAGEHLEARDIHNYRAWRWHLVGRIALEENKLQDALDALYKANQIAADRGGSKTRELYVDLARAAFVSGELSEAERYLGEGVEEHGTPETEAHAAWLRGQVALERGLHEQARGDFKEAIEWFEANQRRQPLWEVLHGAALAHFAAGSFQQGTLLLRQARDLLTDLVQEVPSSLQPQYTARRAALALYSSLEAVSNSKTPQLSLRAFHQSDSEPETTEPLPLFAKMVGQDPALRSVFQRVKVVAASASTVLILGESGTGKELLADAIHMHSDRQGSPFIKVNCGAFVETLLLSELFGHEKGAFTGALSQKVGRFEQANNGTLFLDEIGELSSNTQVALLRVLQEGTFERVGGNKTLKSNARIICATNRKLEQLVKNGEFRLDLYYRIKGVVFELPPLRERSLDVVLLARHFLKEANPQEPKRFTRSALERLLQYSWPGNIRELQNFVRSLSLFIKGSLIEREDIDTFGDFFSDGEFRQSTSEIEAALDQAMKMPSEKVLVSPSQAPQEVAPQGPDLVGRVLGGEIGLAEMKREMEAACIERALIQTKGNITQAAGLLQMKRPRLSQIVNSNSRLEELRQSLMQS